MPLKRRRAKAQLFCVTSEAAVRWRKVGPGAMNKVCIADFELAELLGLEPLLAMSDADLTALRDALDAAGGSRAGYAIRIARARHHRITAEAVEAFKAGISLHRALGLRPWQCSPLPLEVTALGCGPESPPDSFASRLNESWQLACELQAELRKAAKWQTT